MRGRGQREIEALGFGGKEGMRNLEKHPGTVACLRVGAHRAAVLQVLENAQAICDDLVAFDVVDVGDEADAASIVLVHRIIEPGRPGQTFGPPLETGSSVMPHGFRSLALASFAGNAGIQSLSTGVWGWCPAPLVDPGAFDQDPLPSASASGRSCQSFFAWARG